MRTRIPLIAYLVLAATAGTPARAAAKGESSNATYYTPTCASPGACGSQYSGRDPDPYQCWVGHPQYGSTAGDNPIRLNDIPAEIGRQR